MHLASGGRCAGALHVEAMAPSGQSETARTKPALLAGVLLYVVCWLVPVFQGQELFGAMGGFAQSLDVHPDAAAGWMHGPDWLPGWSACHFAWRLLTEVPSPSGGSDDWKRTVVGSTCLTNLAMLTVMLVLACGARQRQLGALLLACALLNTSWIWFGGV